MEIIKKRIFNGIELSVLDSDTVNWSKVRHLKDMNCDNPSDYENAMNDINYEIIIIDGKIYAVSNYEYITDEDIHEYINSMGGIDYPIRYY